MASNTATVGVLASILFIAIVLITSFNFIGQEIYTKQSANLDTTSVNIINNLNNGATTSYNNQTLSLSQNSVANLSSNGSFVNVDPYSRQYLEDKGTGNNNEGVIGRIISLPSFLYNLIGLDMPPFVIAIIGIISSFILFIIGLAIFKFIKGEVD